MPTLEQGSDSRRTMRKTLITARSVRKKYSPFWDRYRKELTGRFYRDGEGTRNMTNYPYLFQSTFLPELVARDPYVNVRARRENAHAKQSLANELAINQTIVRSRFTDQLRLSICDAFYAFPYMVTGLYPSPISDPGWEGMDPGSMFGDRQWRDANIPFADRVSPYDAIWDDDATEFQRGVHCGHEFLREVDALMGDDRYDLTHVNRDEIQSAVDLMAPSRRKKWEDNYDEAEIPKMAQMVQLYVRPTKQIYTLVQMSDQKWEIIRKVPFWGREEGPYHMGGFTPVPDRVLPLAPAVAWWEQYVELELQERAANKQAMAEKRGVSANTGDEEALKRYFKSGDDHALLGIPDGSIHEIHTGGVTRERLVYLQTRRDNLEYHSSITDTRRGVGGESNTATEATLVDKAQNVRVQDQRRNIANFVQEIVADWLWYFHNDPSVAITATHTDEMGIKRDVLIEGGAEIDPVTGNPVPGQPDPTDFMLEVDANSLYMDNTEMRRARTLQEAGFVINFIRPMLMSQGADINVIQFTNWFAENADIQQLSSWIVPLSPMAAQFMQMAAMSQQGGGEVADLVNVGSGVQSRIQNDPTTNMANSNATRGASPMRLAATMPGSNNSPAGMA